MLLFPAREIFISVHSSNKQANSPAISKVSASQLIFVCVSQSLKSFSRGAAGLTWMGFLNGVLGVVVQIPPQLVDVETEDMSPTQQEENAQHRDLK